ncbi:hypothetical protein P7C70_g4474, partial [Phenoliferia sp. Uapishka_3]
MKAIYVGKTERELKDYPIPSPAAGEILIKNIAVSSNPKDWKLPIYIPGYAAVEGNDVAGHVESIGEGVTRFKVGDKVAAFTKMRSGDQYGAYAEYSVSPEGTAFHLGPKTSFEEASALPLAYMTAAIGLFKRLSLPLPGSSPTSPPTPVLIWGASGAVGAYATQLAKKAGLYVVGIAGSGSSIATSLGADEVIDYRHKTMEELSLAISAAAGGKIKHAFDCISEGGTLESITSALSRNGGGKYTYVLTYSDEELAAVPKNVQHERTLVATAYGEDEKFATEWFDKLGEWMEKGEFKSQKVTVLEGGLKGVEEGLRRLKEGEVRSEKFVYIVKDTPGL